MVLLNMPMQRRWIPEISGSVIILIWHRIKVYF
ncbi:conserved hypothetical protein, partial [Escherichia coli B088]